MNAELAVGYIWAVVSLFPRHNHSALSDKSSSLCRVLFSQWVWMGHHSLLPSLLMCWPCTGSILLPQGFFSFPGLVDTKLEVFPGPDWLNSYLLFNWRLFGSVALIDLCSSPVSPSSLSSTHPCFRSADATLCCLPDNGFHSLVFFFN